MTVANFGRAEGNQRASSRVRSSGGGGGLAAGTRSLGRAGGAAYLRYLDALDIRYQVPQPVSGRGMPQESLVTETGTPKLTRRQPPCPGMPLAEAPSGSLLSPKQP